MTFRNNLDDSAAPSATISGGSWSGIAEAFETGSTTVVVYTITTVDTASAATVSIATATSADGITGGAYTISIPVNATLSSTLTVTNP